MKLVTPAAFLVVLVGGCDWELQRMIDQPRCDVGEATPWLPDGQCDQPTPAGSVPWREAAEPAFERRSREVQDDKQERVALEPVPNRATIARGMDRFDRFCAPCHGALGDGRSVIARDMVLRAPPSLHEPRIVEQTNRRMFEVIGDGYGLMPGYRAVLRPDDRWAIVHYVRVLERSQATSLEQLSGVHAAEAARWLR